MMLYEFLFDEALCSMFYENMILVISLFHETREDQSNVICQDFVSDKIVFRLLIQKSTKELGLACKVS